MKFHLCLISSILDSQTFWTRHLRVEFGAKYCVILSFGAPSLVSLTLEDWVLCQECWSIRLLSSNPHKNMIEGLTGFVLDKMTRVRNAYCNDWSTILLCGTKTYDPWRDLPFIYKKACIALMVSLFYYIRRPN